MIVWIALGLVLALGVVAIWSAHIPGVRRLTGAAPLLPEEGEGAVPPPVRCAGCIGCGGPDCIERPEPASKENRA